MSIIFTEENGFYCIDCTSAVWATDKMHEDYHEAKIHIKDVDFVIENESYLLLIEYKNASVLGASKPGDFRPEQDNAFSKVVQKFYDSLHYLRLLDKTKPIWYIYVLEYPNGETVTRKRLRNRLKKNLPFDLQAKIGNGIKLIEKVDVVSIDEWNKDEEYGRYPIFPVPIV